MTDAASSDLNISNNRLAWIDVARAIAILLVVFFHVNQGMAARGWSVEPLPWLNTQLATFRMPLFFMVSGFLATKYVLNGSLRQLFWRRIALLLWMYVLWSTVRWFYYDYVPWPYDRTIAPIVDPLTAFITPPSGLWFLYGLMLYLLASWCMRRLHPLAQVGIAALLSLAFATQIIKIGTAYTWNSIGTYFLFFVIGVTGSHLIKQVAQRVTIWWLVGATLAFAAGTLLRPRLPFYSATEVPVAVIGSFFGICLAVMISRVNALYRPLSYIGARTLPIYVMHPLIIGAALAAVPVAKSIAFPMVALLWIGCVALALGIYTVMKNVPGLFTLPPFVNAYASEATRKPASSMPVVLPEPSTAA